MTRFDILDPIPFQGLFASSDFSFPQGEMHSLSGRVYPFVSISSAAAFLFHHIQLPHPRVVVPAFICPIVLEVMESCGIEPIPIDVNLNDYQLSLEALSGFDLSKVGAIWVSHTLGFPSDVKALRSLYHGIIIEDCAHAWGTQLHDQQVGFEGDFSFFSLYKQTPNFSGGMLWSAKQNFQKEYEGLEEATFLPTEGWRALLRLSLFPQSLLNAFRRHRPLPAMSEKAHRSFETLRASNRVKALFSYGSKRLTKKTAELHTLSQVYAEQSEEGYFILPKSSLSKIIPSHFRWSMRLIPSLAHLRDPLCLSLRQQGIFIDRLWHNAPHHDHPHAKLLSETILNLPLKPEYTQADAKTLFSTLNTTLRKLL